MMITDLFGNRFLDHPGADGRVSGDALAIAVSNAGASVRNAARC